LTDACKTQWLISKIQLHISHKEDNCLYTVLIASITGIFRYLHVHCERRHNLLVTFVVANHCVLNHVYHYFISIVYQLLEQALFLFPRSNLCHGTVSTTASFLFRMKPTVGYFYPIKECMPERVASQFECMLRSTSSVPRPCVVVEVPCAKRQYLVLLLRSIGL
jgi:hypothetical protein